MLKIKERNQPHEKLYSKLLEKKIIYDTSNQQIPNQVMANPQGLEVKFWGLCIARWILQEMWRVIAKLCNVCKM